MTIREIRVFAVELETVDEYTMSSSAVATPVSTVIEVVDSSGLVGFGEVCMASRQYQAATNESIRADLATFAPAVLGLDPCLHGVVNAVMGAAGDGFREARAAIDIACWDLAGKLLDRPVVDLLGGQRMSEVITYHVVGIGSPEDAAAKATELQEAGIQRIQLKTGGRPVEDDIASIRAVVEALNDDTSLAVDTNRGWSVKEAIAVSNALPDLAFSLEQPCSTVAELEQVREHANHPIIVDESATDLATIATMISSGLAAGFGLKISRAGGLTPMLAIRDLCMATSTPMSSDDAWGGDIIAAAGVALGATIDPLLSRGAWIAHPYHQTHYDEVNGPRIESGHVTLPSAGPGLGLDLTPGQFGDPVAVYQ